MKLRAAVAAKVGAVRSALDASGGSVAAFSATLVAEQGVYFCKGVPVEAGAALRAMRNEARLNSALPAGIVPRLRWTVEEAGWLVLGFDHAPGRHADLDVGSADLPAVAAALTALSEVLTPCPAVDVQPATARWEKWIDPGVVDGNTLAHTDVTPKNFLVSEVLGVRVVDWSMPVRGAAWIDAARMVVRLVRAGHTPEEAEAWAAGVPAFAAAPESSLSAFADMAARLSAHRRSESAAEHVHQLAAAAASWSRLRAG